MRTKDTRYFIHRGSDDIYRVTPHWRYGNIWEVWRQKSKQWMGVQGSEAFVIGSPTFKEITEEDAFVEVI